MSLELNGTSQFLETASAVITTYPATMCAWIRLDDATVNNCIVGVFDESSEQQWMMLEAQGGTTGDPIDCFARAGTTYHARTTTGYSTATWYPVIAVFTSSTSRSAYISGGSVGTNTSSATPSGLDTTTIGATGDSSRTSYTNGLISHVAIFDVAFSAQNISDFSDGTLPDDLGISSSNLLTYLPLTDDATDSTGNYTYTATGSPTYSSTEPPVDGDVIALTGDVEMGIEVDGTQDRAGAVQLTADVEMGIEVSGLQDRVGAVQLTADVEMGIEFDAVQDADPIWAFFGDSETNGAVADPPSNSPNAVVALLETSVDVYKDGVGGCSLEQSRQRYLATSNRANYAKVIFQESGNQALDGQRTATQFEATFLATMRDIADDSPDAEIYYETAYSFRREAESYRDWGVYTDSDDYNGKLARAISTLDSEGITVYLARTDRDIKSLVTEITYDEVCFPDGDSSSYHYQAPGNLLIGLQHMQNMGYNVRGLDLSPITDVSDSYKETILDIVAPVEAMTANVSMGISVEGVQDTQEKIQLTANVKTGIRVFGTLGSETSLVVAIETLFNEIYYREED